MVTKHEVTETQLGACTRIAELAAKQVFCLVKNARELVNLDGEIIEYKVLYNRQFGRIQCLPFNGPACPASLDGTTCGHMRAAHKAAEIFKAELKVKIAECERTLREIEQDDCELAIECLYSQVVDPTSSSFDGVKWEVCPTTGRMVPMR